LAGPNRRPCRRGQKDGKRRCTKVFAAFCRRGKTTCAEPAKISLSLTPKAPKRISGLNLTSFPASIARDFSGAMQCTGFSVGRVRLRLTASGRETPIRCEGQHARLHSGEVTSRRQSPLPLRPPLDRQSSHPQGRLGGFPAAVLLAAKEAPLGNRRDADHAGLLQRRTLGSRRQSWDTWPSLMCLQRASTRSPRWTRVGPLATQVTGLTYRTQRQRAGLGRSNPTPVGSPLDA